MKRFLFCGLFLLLASAAGTLYSQPYPTWQYPMWQWPGQRAQMMQPAPMRPPAYNKPADGNAAPAPAGPEANRGARPDGQWQHISDHIKAARVQFFTSRMDLTPSEAQAFWPIYNELDAKKDVLYKQRADLTVKYMQQSSTLTDKELEQMLNEYMGISQKENKLTTEYHKKFLSVLPAAKVMRLYMTEEQFKNSYLQRLRGGQEQPPRPQQPKQE